MLVTHLSCARDVHDTCNTSICSIGCAGHVASFQGVIRKGGRLAPRSVTIVRACLPRLEGYPGRGSKIRSTTGSPLRYAVPARPLDFWQRLNSCTRPTAWMHTHCMWRCCSDGDVCMFCFTYLYSHYVDVVLFAFFAC